MNLAKYGSVFNIGLQNTFVYRWNYFLRALFGLIPLAGTVFLWRAIFREPGGKGFGGYDYGSMIYYYLLTILVSNLVTPTEDDWQIAADIREGQINSFLTKPLSYLGYRTGIFLAGRLVYTAVTIIPIALIFFYFRDYLLLPPSAATYLLSITSLIMAAFIQFFITYSLAMMAFWVLEISTIVFIVYSFEYFRRPDVSGRYYANWRASSHEMAAVLLRAILPDRDFSRPPARRRVGSGTGYPVLLANSHLGRRPTHVEAGPRPLPGRWWIAWIRYWLQRLIRRASMLWLFCHR